MYLEFSKITIENFKTFIGEPTTLKLSGGPGLCFIKGRNENEPELGSNGAAKSSLFAALSWCLFGQVVGGLRTPDIIPWSGKGDPRVTVTVFKDEQKYTITRSTKPNQLLLNQAETGQTEVEEFLGFNFDVFKHTILFGQGQPLFFDLSPREKMDVFAAALNLDRWETRSGLASDKAREITATLEDSKRLIASDEAVLESSNKQLKLSQQLSDGWEKEQKGRAKEIDEERKKLNGQLDKIIQNHYKAELAVDSAGTEIKDLDCGIAKLVDKRSKAQSEYNKVEIMLNGQKDVIKALSKELKGLDGKNDTCPTCGQSLEGTALAHHKKELVKRIKQLGANVEEGVPTNIAQALDKAEKDVESARKHLENFQDKADTAQAELNISGPEIARIKAQLNALKILQEEGGKENNPHRASMQSLKKQVNHTEIELNNLLDEVKILEADFTRTAYWIKGFKAVRLYLLEELLEELELATNAMLPESGLHNWVIHYDLEKETKKGSVVSGLNVTVLSPNNKKPVRWDCWSGGEKHRLRLVGALALSEVLLSHANVEANLEVLDEPTRDLSVEGVQDLCEYLANRAQQLDKDIFLMGHNVIESAYFSKTITVVKEKGASSYVEQS